MSCHGTAPLPHSESCTVVVVQANATNRGRGSCNKHLGPISQGPTSPPSMPLLPRQSKVLKRQLCFANRTQVALLPFMKSIGGNSNHLFQMSKQMTTSPSRHQTVHLWRFPRKSLAGFPSRRPFYTHALGPGIELLRVLHVRRRWRSQAGRRSSSFSCPRHLKSSAATAASMNLRAIQQPFQ